jgi:hypothetical protein
MDLHAILETVFLGMFWIGLVLTILMGALSGAFHHEVGAGSSFDTGVAHDLGGPHVEAGAGFHPAHPEVGWAHGEIPGFSPWSPTVICAALTGAGGVGYIALAVWRWSVAASSLTAIAAGLAIGGTTFGVLAFVFKRVQGTSHVAVADMVGQRARVDTTIESGVAGSIAFEAGGGRMVVPAKSVDSSAIPRNAEVEIVLVEAGVYHVKETRESWLARSKGPAR